MTTSVTAQQLAKRVIELLGIKPGETVELACLRGGDVLIHKVEQGQGPP